MSIYNYSGPTLAFLLPEAQVSAPLILNAIMMSVRGSETTLTQTSKLLVTLPGALKQDLSPKGTIHSLREVLK